MRKSRPQADDDRDLRCPLWEGMPPSKRSHRSGLRETDRLLQRIRTLVGEANGRSTVTQRREIERLKAQLAERVKQDPTGQ
jgi:hypothetical protein